MVMRFCWPVREGNIMKRWVMHIIGPDEIHDMPDEITALREANKLNKRIVKWREDDPSPNDPFMVALVEERTDGS